VLQSGLTITIHVRPDAAGRRVVYIVGREGLRGAQVKSPDGTTGFVDRSVLIGAVSKAALSRGEQQMAANQVLRSARLVCSAEGDWQIAVPDPMQMVDVVATAESVLRA